MQYGPTCPLWTTSGGPAKVGTVTNENTERLLTPHQVAEMFRVDPKTVARWASSGRIGSIRTPGGHRRFRETEILALLAERAVPAARGPPDPCPAAEL